MKIRILTFLSCIAFAFNAEVKSHSVSGGEITWVCLPNGQYIFKMNLYRDCDGTSFYFSNQSLSYPGGSIVMKPDSNLWMSYGGDGNISYQGPNGCQMSCGNPPSLGTYQFFPYISDPVTLNGVPPPGGWLFTWGPMCCRHNDPNLSNGSGESYVLRAKMYPYKGKNFNLCYDSSPKFDEMPSFLFCKGTDIKYNHNASDRDLDSLVFSWAEAWSNSNLSVNYASGYSFNNPLPDSNINPLNNAANLNPHTGEMDFTVHSSIDYAGYTTVVRVDSYRDGILISSVFRDLPFAFVTCPDLQGTNAANNPAMVFFNGMPADDFSDTVFAGQKISIPVTSIESDIVFDIPNDPSTARLQYNYISPSGMMFSNDFTDSLACQNQNAAPCATLSPAPLINPLNGKMELSNQGSVSTTFDWQTDCVHLGGDSVNSKSYHFIFKNYDESCNTPMVNYPTLQVVVARYFPKIQQNGNTLFVDPAESYQWYFNGVPIPNSDTSAIIITALGKYSVEVVKYGCDSRRAHYQVLSVSLEENDWRNEVSVYPNPFKDGFVVELSSTSLASMEFQLFDMQGREVEINFRKNSNRILIDATKSIHQGVYLLEISSENQKVLKKIVKL